MSNALRVEPAFFHVPDFHDTDGPEVAALAELAGFPPDDEQRMLLDAAFAVDKRGRAAAFMVAAICCRQNLKTGFFKQCALGWLFITDQRLIVWSAHEFGTAVEAFRDMTELIEGSDVLSSRVKKIYRGNGDESIEMMSGQRLIFKARTKGGGRGLSGDKVVLDEGFALQPVHMGALLPTLSARPDPQVLIGSSAGLTESSYLRSVRDRGRAGTGRIAYAEWTAEGAACQMRNCSHVFGAVEGCAMDDPANWVRGNPTLGKRMTFETVQGERESLPPLEFGRERMGWWDNPGAAGETAVDLQAWAALTKEDAKLAKPHRVCLGIDVAPDRSRASVGVAGTGKGGRELLMTRSGVGVDWVVAEVVRLVGKHRPLEVALFPGAQSYVLVPDLKAEGIEPVLLSTREMGQACSAFQEGVTGKRFVHLGQPELDAAVMAATTRTSGEVQLWDRRDGTDITPLVAASIAASGYARTASLNVDVKDTIW